MLFWSSYRYGEKEYIVRHRNGSQFEVYILPGCEINIIKKIWYDYDMIWILYDMIWYDISSYYITPYHIISYHIKPHGYELSWVRVVLGTSCLGYKLSWVRVVLGTSCPGYELSWVRVVLGTSCLGYELSRSPSYVSTREVQLSPAVTQSPERRTITVIPSPAWPDHVEPAAEVEGPATVTGPSEVVDGPADDGLASDGPAGDDPASDGPADDGSAYNGSAGDGSARPDEPVVIDGPEEVADPASQQSATDDPALQFDNPAGVAGPARLQPLALDGPAAHGTPAGNTPSAGQDSSILTGVSSPLFPSMPTAINQAALIDFMSMWTLLQRRMDQGLAVSDAQARPAAQSTVPVPRDDTPPRRSDTPPRTPDRRPRMPIKRVRTPVRRARGLDNTRESTRSRSPVTRSSSVDSPTRDASPVNFSVALDPEDKIKQLPGTHPPTPLRRGLSAKI